MTNELNDVGQASNGSKLPTKTKSKGKKQRNRSSQRHSEADALTRLPPDGAEQHGGSFAQRGVAAASENLEEGAGDRRPFFMDGLGSQWC